MASPRVAPAAELAAGSLLRIARDLIAIPSWTPEPGEEEMARAVMERLPAACEDVRLVEIAPGRPSLGARLRGASDGPSIVLNGHLDTVAPGAPESWTASPLAAVVEGDRLFGRGAADMKGGLAVMLGVTAFFARRPELLRGDLVLHFAAGEESGEAGTEALLDAGYGGDCAVTLEPTQLELFVAARGSVKVDVVLRGRSGHASLPAEAANPIDGIGRVLAAVDRYLRDVSPPEGALLPAPTCVPTIVQAGSETNVIPEVARITLDRRLSPGEDKDVELARLERFVEEALTGSSLTAAVSLRPGSFPPGVVDVEAPIVRAMRASLEEGGAGTCVPKGAPYACDANRLLAAGIDAITFGPGSIADAHKPNESIVVEQLPRAAEHLTAAILRVGQEDP